MKRVFTKQEAIEFLGCSESTRPYRIIEGLERCGFKNVEKTGRGNKVTYSCEQSDDTDEQCYHLFKDILINEFGYSKKFDYDLALDIINFHIYNEEYTTLEEIIETINTEVSPSTISKHRAKLSKKIVNGAKTYGIVLPTDECYKKPFAKDLYTKELKDITDIYETIILNSFRTQLKRISTVEKDAYKYATILYNKQIQDYKLLFKDKRMDDDFTDCIYKFKEEGYEHYGTFMIWHSLHTSNPQINSALYKTLFNVNLKCHGFDFVTYKRIYRITQELEDDEEFLNIIKKAIKFKKSRDEEFDDIE